MNVSVIWWVKRSFVINTDCSEWNSLVLPFFQRYFISVFRLGLLFWQVTHSVKHAGPEVESISLIASIQSAPLSAHFVVVAES